MTNCASLGLDSYGMTFHLKERIGSWGHEPGQKGVLNTS
jgi:hypothetical protein